MSRSYRLTYETSAGDVFDEIFNTEEDMLRFVKAGHVRPLIHCIEESRREECDKIEANIKSHL